MKKGVILLILVAIFVGILAPTVSVYAISWGGIENGKSFTSEAHLQQ